MPEPQAKPAARLKSISPQFPVPDVVVAAEYYRDKLGFKILGYFLDPPVYCIVERDSVEIHLGRLEPDATFSPNSSRRDGGLDAYIWVTDVDALYAELKERGANVIEPPTVRVYNCYEMVVKDIYGFRLAFAMDFQNP
ncbi:MAG TPA: VOC family protein [Candidatus Sulfotelmatobacter sp.]|jgi:hypothetical protein|nr:VOC family protein [Candidatus Sulfotelmatobacter sp.]